VGGNVGWAATAGVGKRMVEQLASTYQPDTLTAGQYAAARRVIRAHYRLKRLPPLAEVDAEIANLRRRGPENLDDGQMALAASLQVRSGGAIDLWGGCREWATCSDDDM
jgi:hypothetical protein